MGLNYKKDDGTNYTDSDFYNGQGVLDQEIVTYTSTIEEAVAYDVYNVNNANELRYVLNI